MLFGARKDILCYHSVVKRGGFYMKDRKYVVSRDDVYVGEVVRAFNIYRDLGEVDIFEAKSGKLDTGSWFSYRSMLFVPDENNFSNDLLYKTPNYPILNVTDDNVCLGLGKNSIVIRDACNLAELLEYFDYGKDLTFEDIMKIRKTFFTGKFAKDNCQLFGWRETMAEDLVFYLKGKELTDAWEIEKEEENLEENKRLDTESFWGK